MNAPRSGRWQLLFAGKAFASALAVAMSFCSSTLAQDAGIPVDGSYVSSGAPPMAHQGGGSFYSQQLGAHLRVRYNTESYGQNQGNFDIGTMKYYDMGNSMAFLDGQVTMNDADGVGFNTGTGYRWLSDPVFPFSADAQRLMGASFWVDGSSTPTDHFFPQIGLSLEALGDKTDFRGNLYLPVGPQKKYGEQIATGELLFVGNALAQETLSKTDNALTVGELEVARRLFNREAWAFAGGYTASSDDFSTEGVKVGVRGYAVPDVFVQLAITDDDLFETNAVFTVGWFIGRTRTNYCATGTLRDRFREPVLRNDYVAIYQSQTTGGTALTDADGDAIRFVHVDSTAAAGGNGTFESPLNNLSDIDNNSQIGDIVLAHSGSVFTDSATLLAQQRFLGEGGNVVHTFVSSQLGTINIPETAPGAAAGAVPVINAVAGATSITLADANEVNNFTINGGATGIDGTNSAGDPTIRNVTINNTTGNGITLESFARADADDDDNDGDTTEVAFNVTIDNVDLNNVGGTGIALDGQSGANLADTTVDLNEAINIQNVNVVGGSGVGIAAVNTNTGGTMVVNNYTYDGNATGLGGLSLNNADGTTTVTNSSITEGAAGAFGVAMTGSDGRLTVNNTNTLNNITGSAINIDGGAPAQVTVNAAITSTSGDAVVVENITGGAVNITSAITKTGTGRSILVDGISGGNVTFTGAVTDSAAGIAATDNTGGSILFGGTYNLDTTTNDAVTATNNTGSTVTFNGLDVTTTSGRGFVATGGGTIGTQGTNTITSTTNDNTTGTGLTVQNVTVANNGIVFNNVTVNGAANGILIENTTGGQIRVGTTTGAAGSGGTMTTTGNAISVTNATNVQINRVDVTSNAGHAVLATHTDSDAYSLTLNNVELDAGASSDALNASAAGTSTFALTVTGSTLNDNLTLDTADGATNGEDAIDFTFQTSTINATGAGDVAMNLELSSYASADVLVQNNTNIQTTDASAFVLNATDTSAGNTVRFQLSGNTLLNNSATSATANIDAAGGTILNSTITSNVFTNLNGAGPEFTMDNNGFTSVVRLDLRSNTAGTYTLDRGTATFNLVDRDDTFADLNNTGNVVGLPAEAGFGNDAGPIPTP